MQPGAMRSAWALGVGLVLGSWACSMGWDPVKWNSEQTAKIRQRATFEMSCPNESLNVVELDKETDGTVKALGVEGCGKKASYVHLKGYGNEAVWALSSQQN
jgi:hypothetical protein